jgi:hypothetical protein
MMDATVMEFRMKQWMPIFEEQARSGLSKEDWREANNISRSGFYKWQRVIRNYILANNLKMPSIDNEYFQTEPGFIDITPKVSAMALTGKTQAIIHPLETSVGCGLCIRCGRFTIELNGTTEERLLSMALQVISNVE